MYRKYLYKRQYYWNIAYTNSPTNNLNTRLSNTSYIVYSKDYLINNSKFHIHKAIAV
jgi:hypothetical protein